MADWTSGLPQAPQPMNIGGLLDLARKAGELEAVPYQVQQQKTQAANATRESGINYLKSTADIVSGYATKDRPSDEEMGNLFLGLSKQYMPQGAPPNPQAADAIARLHREYDALPKGENERAWKARRQWAAEVGARYGGTAGNMPTVPYYDETTGSVRYKPANVQQRESGGTGGSTGALPPGTQPAPAASPQGRTSPAAPISLDPIAAPVSRAANVPGSVQAGPSVVNEASTKDYQDAQRAISSYQSDTTPGVEAYRAVKGLEEGGHSLGPGTSERAKLAQTLVALAPETAKKLGIDKDAIKWQQSFEKWSANIAANAPNGQENQARFYNALKGNVNADMNNATVKEMIATNLGLSNMWSVAQRQATKLGPGNFTANARAEMDSLDHKAFALNFMDKETRAKTLAEIRRASPQEQAKFARSYQLAQKYEKEGGLVNRQPTP